MMIPACIRTGAFWGEPCLWWPPHPSENPHRLGAIYYRDELRKGGQGPSPAGHFEGRQLLIMIHHRNCSLKLLAFT